MLFIVRVLEGELPAFHHDVQLTFSLFPLTPTTTIRGEICFSPAECVLLQSLVFFTQSLTVETCVSDDLPVLLALFANGQLREDSKLHVLVRLDHLRYV